MNEFFDYPQFDDQPENGRSDAEQPELNAQQSEWKEEQPKEEQSGYQFHIEPEAGYEEPVHTPVYQAPLAPVKKRSWGKAIALGLCCALIGGGIGITGFMIGSRHQTQDSVQTSTMMVGQRESAKLNAAGIDTSKEMSAAEVYAANVNSTVGIQTSITTNYWGIQTQSAVAGSGFILSADGYILTNYHVVENSNSITVSAYDGTTYDASLVGFDESNDIAVLKVDAENLTPVVIGDSDQLNVGDSVVAIGNPLGELTFSLTSGAVSALNREITLSGGITMNLIQTDCAINSGNSGGALFNMNGEVVGITNAKYSSASSSGASIDNIGFAIPISHVIDIVQSIIEDGYISKPYIGVTFSQVSEDALRYGLPEGVALISVTEDSPAAKAGLQANDIITKVNDTEITDQEDFSEAIANAQIGETLTLTIYRQGETSTVEIEVGEKVQSALGDDETEQNSQQEQQGQQYQGDIPWSDLLPRIFGGY